MSRRPNKDALEARLIREKFGLSSRNHLYKRIAAGKAFGLFIIDGRLSFADYPSARCSGLSVDCPDCVVGIYVDMPSLVDVVADLRETSQRTETASAAAT